MQDQTGFVFKPDTTMECEYPHKLLLYDPLESPLDLNLILVPFGTIMLFKISIPSSMF